MFILCFAFSFYVLNFQQVRVDCYDELVYTKPVNIHFRALWLATQAQDIHWISIGLQNTMDARRK